MNRVRLGAVLFGLWILGNLGAVGCGNDSVALDIDPDDAIVKMGQSQQFSANESNVTWSVDGGNSNGMIDSGGLYTAPSSLPSNPTVTVRATKGQETATATVHLVTSDTLVFSSEPELVSMDPAHRMDDEGLFAPGTQDHLAVLWLGDRVDVTWGSDNVYFNQRTPTMDFGDERTLPNTTDALALGIEEDQDRNPVILFNHGGLNNGRVKVMTSANGGATFGNPVAVLGSVPAGDFQFQASLAIDEQNIFHVVLENGPNSGVGFTPIDGTLFYSKSTDGGATWSANPVPIVAPAGSDDVISSPHIKVDAEGNIYVCYSVDPDGGVGQGTFDLFFAKSSDGGASFESTNLTPDTVADSNFCHLSLGPDGQIYLSYSSNVQSDSDILLVRSLDGGETFSSPTLVNSDTAGFQTFAFISTDIAGRIAAIWASDLGQNFLLGAVMYAQSLDGGVTFSDNDPIASGPPADFRLPMGLRHDLAGRLHVLFADNTNDPGTNADIYYLLGQ